MRLLLCAAVVLGCALYLAAQSSRPSDLTIVIRTTVGQSSFTRTEYIKGPRSRIESISAYERPAWKGGPMIRMFGHPLAAINQCDQHRVLELDLLTHEYTSIELDDRGVPASPANAVPTAPSGRTVRITDETTDTGEREEFFGRTARHIITKRTIVRNPDAISSGAQSEQDGWYLDLDANAGCGAHTTAALGGVLMARSSGGEGLGSLPMLVDKVEWKTIGTPVTGLPVELTSWSSPDGRDDARASSIQFKSEVTQLSTAPLDPALFDVSAGFTKVDHLDYRQSASWSSQVQVWWYMIEQDFSGLFR
jgi:hypothetical protein